MKSGKAVIRSKHLPQRTCVGCRLVLPKRTLVRVVRGAEHVQVDPTGKLAGRGAYLHNARACWEKGLKGALAHALKTDLSPEDLASLHQYMDSLVDRAEDPGKDV